MVRVHEEGVDASDGRCRHRRDRGDGRGARLRGRSVDAERRVDGRRQGYPTADPAVCDLSTARPQQLFARLGKRATCREALTAIRIADDARSDKDAHTALRETLQATQVLIDARAKASRTRRLWLAPHLSVRALVADMRAHDIEVRLGRGPASARGTATRLVLVDGTRTTATKLVLYTESTSGTIWRLTSSPYQLGTPTRAGRGVAVCTVAPARSFVYRPPSGSNVARVD